MTQAFDERSWTYGSVCSARWAKLGLAGALLSLSSCSSFELEQVLVGTPALSPGGRSIALGKSLAAVGVGDGSPTNPRAVDVFERDRRGGWSFVERLTALPGTVGRFGEALALHGRTIAVGAPENDDSGTPEIETGYVDIFERGPGGFVRTNTVVPESATPISEGAEVSFGSALSLDERYLAVGAKRFRGENGNGIGRAFVFDRGDYSQLVELAEPAALQRFDANFGDTVQLSRGTLIVTRPDTPASTQPPKNGKVYVYTSADGFTTPEVLEGVAATTEFDGFGTAAAIFGGTIAVRDELSVQLFTQAGGSWQFQAQVASDDASRNSLALDAQRLFIGEPNATAAGLARAGQVRIFDRSALPPVLESTLLDPTPTADGQFGAQLALSRRTLGVTTGDAERALVFRQP